LRAKKFADGFYRLHTRVRIKADGSTASYASVVPGESLSGIEIDDIAGLLFFAAAVGGKDSIGQDENGRVQGIVKGVTRTFVDGELNVLSGTL
jgi:hypothetical protein